MAIRGVYSNEEGAFLAKVRAFKLESEWLPEFTPGNPWANYTLVATKELINIHARAFDDANPLYIDEAYARDTKWGSIIAPPFFPYAISQAGSGVFDIMKDCPPSLGQPTANNAGSAWDFYQPIRADDSFRIKEAPEQTLTDVTRQDGQGPRQLLWSRDKLFLNQHDAVVAVCHRRIFWIFAPPGEDQRPSISTHPPLKEYVYAKAELNAADDTYDAEEIRGSLPRYWEDVAVGDDLIPVIDGPITLMEQVLQIAGELILGSMRLARKTNPEMFLEDPVTHVPHHLGEYHLHDRIAQEIGISMAFTEGTRADFHAGKLLSRWYGDDGFLRRYDSQHRNFCPLGDTVWHRGKVIRKYVEDGQAMVDVACWAESIRGWINMMGTAGIILPTRSPVDNPAAETPTASAVKVGDRVSIKDRPDWPIPYRFVGAVGTVFQIRHPQDFVGISLENTAVKDQVTEVLKPGTSLIFRTEHVEIMAPA